MKYVALFTLGCFCILSSFAYGRAAQWQPRPQAHVAPVELRAPVGYDLDEIAALNELAARKPTKSERAANNLEKEKAYAARERERCQDDYVCLIAWAERSNPHPARP